MNFWTFMFLLIVLTVFAIAQMIKVLNGDSKAGELGRQFVAGIIERIRRRADAQADNSQEK